MCLAIFSPKGNTVSRKHLENGFDGNSDGAGFCFAQSGKIEIRKGFFDFESFYAAFEPVAHLPCLVHFRYATHGSINPDNCHPFPILGDKFGMIHNGIIQIEPLPGRSDSHAFAERILAPVLNAGVSPDSPALKFLVEKTIGSGNKICLLSGTGKATIYNESCGEWHRGAWFSNSGFQFSSRDAEINALIADGYAAEDAMTF
jgi:glutamine amidotransferase